MLGLGTHLGVLGLGGGLNDLMLLRLRRRRALLLLVRRRMLSHVGLGLAVRRRGLLLGHGHRLGGTLVGARRLLGHDLLVLDLMHVVAGLDIVMLLRLGMLMWGGPAGGAAGRSGEAEEEGAAE